MKKLIWAYPFAAVAILLNSFVSALPAVAMRALGLKKAASWWISFHNAAISDFLLWLLNVHVSLSGNVCALMEMIRSGRKICFIANHTSMLDILMISGSIPTGSGFIAKSSLAGVPFINLILWGTDCVLISRKSLRQSARAIRKGVENIKNGSRMTIFPEGTRSKTGEIAPFKHGSFKLATLSGADIVPITIKGARAALEDRKKAFCRTSCHLHIGDAVPTEGLDRKSVAELEERIEQEIKKVYSCL